QWAQRFAQHYKRGYMNRSFANFGYKSVTFNANYIANITVFFKHQIIKAFVLAWANIVFTNIQLNATGSVLQAHKSSLTHIAHAHDTASYANVVIGISIFWGEIFENILCRSINIESLSRISINAHFV